MTAATKISSCVDCATPIIGERLRCPACHDRHAENLLSGDEDATLPRERSRPLPSIWQALVSWLVASLIIAGAVLMVAAGRSCS